MELKIGKAGGRDFYVNAQELVTGRTCIIAQSGAGKSWSIAVLCEKMCRNNIGFCLIDTEGEYYSLKEKFENIWWIGAEGGDSECDGIKMDYDIEKVNIHHILQRAVSESRPVIFDVSEVDMIPRVTKMVHALYDVATDQRKAYLLIVEEADKFIPQSKDSIKKIEEISRRGRKRGLGIMVATQRPAIVTKNVLSQCNNQIIGKLSIENDLKAVGLFFSSKQEVEELTTLNPGDFFVMGNLVNEKTKMRFGNRETQHRGLTPLLEYREISEEEEQPEEPESDELAGSFLDNSESESVEFIKDDIFSADETDMRISITERKTSDIKSEEKKPVSKSKPVVKKSRSKPLIAERVKNEAVIPLIEREEALEIALGKLRKKRLGFGLEEKLVSADLVYIPLIKISLKYIGGLLRKSAKKSFYLIDGRNGAGVDLSSGIKYKPCFSEYIGLDEPSIVILDVMSIKGDTAAGLEAKTRLDKKTVEKSLSNLESKKLITQSETVGESDKPVYVPLVSYPLPSLKSRFFSSDLRMGPLDGGFTEKKEVDESDIRTILKVIEPTSEIIEFITFYYPVFRITVAAGYEERTVHIDALTGKEVIFDIY
ncbi:MAG: DUF87 domain-containing protein [Methanomicrobiaceae archaeon]|nr:DUF87 domain-containing protein [Methanomicrobiaceae archaeon]